MTTLAADYEHTGVTLRSGDNKKKDAISRAPDGGRVVESKAKPQALPKTMRALVVPEPGAVLEVQTIPVPVPKRGEVLIRVAASPINPSDLLMLSGEYGVERPCPFVPGLEGSGEVVASGGGFLAQSLIGKLVACAPKDTGLWSEYAIVPANRCVPLPKGMSAETGAMTFVNPLCAIALVDTAKRGGHKVVVSTAAGGALGQMIRARAQDKGIAVIDVVRRIDQARELVADGAQHVFASQSETFEKDLQALCKELRCRLAFDAVAGDMTGKLADALEPNGEILVYGELSGKPATCDPATLTFKELTVRGFWLTRWSERQPFLKQLLLTRQIMKALRGGFAETKVNKVVGLDDALSAPSLYASNMSAGKVLISPAVLEAT